MNQAISAVSDWIVAPLYCPLNGRLLLRLVNMRMSPVSPTVPATVPPVTVVVAKLLSLEPVRLLTGVGEGQFADPGGAAFAVLPVALFVLDAAGREHSDGQSLDVHLQPQLARPQPVGRLQGRPRIIDAGAQLGEHLRHRRHEHQRQGGGNEHFDQRIAGRKETSGAAAAGPNGP